MANLKGELKSRHASLRRLYDDLKSSSFARQGWKTDVRARRTLGTDETIEHWFLAEHFLTTWSNWRGLLDRFNRYFGQSEDSFPKTWAQFIVGCDVLVFRLVREKELDETIARTWLSPEIGSNGKHKRRQYDISGIYTRIATSHERADLVVRAARVQPRFATKKDGASKSAELAAAPEHDPFGMARSVVFEQNERLLDEWHELPRRVQDQVSVHLRHYLHSVLGVSWLVDSTPSFSALLNISWRKQPVSISLQQPSGLAGLDSPISGSVGRLLERLKVAIAELGYEAVIEDLSSSELVGGEGSLLGSDDVMVVPGHMEDSARPILLAVTTGWSGKGPQALAKIMRQVKARLTESRGAVQVVIVFCDCWDSASFQEEHREELSAHDRNGVRFLFFMVGVPDRVLVPVPVSFNNAAD
jgi:hypothetical protein